MTEKDTLIAIINEQARVIKYLLQMNGIEPLIVNELKRITEINELERMYNKEG